MERINKKIVEQENKIKAYKGFNSDMTCRHFKFKVGKEYEESGKIKACKNGFHACENPMDVFGYYPPSNSRYCEVEQSGSIDRGEDKIASSKIRIQCEIGLSGIIQAGVKFILDKVNWKNNNATNTGYRSSAANTGYRSSAANTGDCSTAANTGDCSTAANTGDHSSAANTGDCSTAANTGYRSSAANTGDHSTAVNTGDCSTAANTGYRSSAANTGDCSTAANTGYRSSAANTGDCSTAANTGDCSSAANTGYRSSAVNTGDCSSAANTGNHSTAKVEGKESIAIVTGIDSKACGALGCWLVLTERCEWNGETYPIKEVKAVRVDGKTIKPNTWYKLENGQIIETE